MGQTASAKEHSGTHIRFIDKSKESFGDNKPENETKKWKVSDEDTTHKKPRYFLLDDERGDLATPKDKGESIMYWLRNIGHEENGIEISRDNSSISFDFLHPGEDSDLWMRYESISASEQQGLNRAKKVHIPDFENKLQEISSLDKQLEAIGKKNQERDTIRQHKPREREEARKKAEEKKRRRAEELGSRISQEREIRVKAVENNQRREARRTRWAEVNPLEDVDVAYSDLDSDENFKLAKSASTAMARLLF
ncbi:hypothetical protein G7Y89_g1098 [Cudoniella acicularis]|uniref:Uncharacterized protein n=1 Tax=Cudoniella acicularis TaxID=354080 RepID=A0A8H4RXR5_9HELO|nr:hypothetical protein G7Y89_g1098 [Cudoniella acicularis]